VCDCPSAVIEPELYTLAADFVLSGANSTVAAVLTGLARAALEEALTYCKQRTQGGKLLCEHQLVQRKLFDMFTKVEAARQLSRAVSTYNSAVPPPLSRLSIAAKVFCTQTAFEVTNDAVQLFGGYGLSKDFLVEKLFRDARASLIEDGANDVLALVAARQLIDQHLA
jgi:alkylation response protein AidB-like acyl-CoA dehydrogenase